MNASRREARRGYGTIRVDIIFPLIHIQDKLTEDELTERMARIKAQNDKIKQRRLVGGTTQGKLSG